jgi:hypothetical protein
MKYIVIIKDNLGYGVVESEHTPEMMKDEIIIPFSITVTNYLSMFLPSQHYDIIKRFQSI